MLIYSAAFDGNSGDAIERALKASGVGGGDDEAEAAMAAAAAARVEAETRAALAEMTVMSINPTLTPLAGALIVIRVENAPRDVRVKIAGRSVYSSATEADNGDLLIECQAPVSFVSKSDTFAMTLCSEWIAKVFNR